MIMMMVIRSRNKKKGNSAYSHVSHFDLTHNDALQAIFKTI